MLASIVAGAVSGAGVEGAEKGIGNITIKEADEMLNSRNVVVLDVRSQAEYESEHIAGAKLTHVSELVDRIDELDKGKNIIVYCGSGGRSAKTSEILAQYGFENVYNMLGGITAWIDAGLPIKAPPPSSTTCDSCADCTEPDLLIIAPENFTSVLQPLVDHKEATGMPTQMITLENIYDIFDGADEPEKIKRAIEHYNQIHSIKYVMLISYYFPSDLYYADLYDADGDFDTWDYDEDGYFGEHLKSDSCGSDPYSVNADHADLHPDVAVGRVPASDIKELESYVAKVIRYEHLTADADADWFHNVLLLAGNNCGYRCICTAPHFVDIKNYLGDDFEYRIFLHSECFNTTPNRAPEYQACNCTPDESLIECMGRTGLTVDQINIFRNADGFTDSRLDPSLFEDIGFLAWHDHSSTVANYNRQVNNSNRFTIAFSDGCRDGGFAGRPPGEMKRFVSANLSYREVDGHILKVFFQEIPIDTDGDRVNETYYDITGCEVDGTLYPITVDDHCGGGRFPDMSFCDDFDNFGNRVNRTRPYILNPPLPLPLQPNTCDYDRYNPETKLFAKNSTSGVETGWVGLVAATKGAQFYKNGELESLFFRGYSDPHSSVSGRNRLGDMWRSMLEYWLEIVFDEDAMRSYQGKYRLPDHEVGGVGFIQHNMMYSLFGDPSLRPGGVPGLEDTEPPVTTDDTDSDWQSEELITLTATDFGSPASGVRETKYRVDGRDWITGNHLTIEEGIHRIDYFSVDFLGNKEEVKTAEVKIDTVPPTTEILLDGEPPAMVVCFCSCLCLPDDPECECDCECPERGCYIDSVTVTLNAIDYPPTPTTPVSGIDYTAYYLGDGWPYYVYTGPFDVYGRDFLDRKTLRYWSVDNAGNVKRPPNEVTFCVSNWAAGVTKDEMRILAALEEIIAFRMRKSFVDTLPLIKNVKLDYAGPYPTEEQDWVTMGVDYNGDDGWSIHWDTTKVLDGDYRIRMTVIGSEFKQGSKVYHKQQQDKVIYQEQINVTVCNIPNSAYDFKLYAPDEIDRGEVIDYTLKFANRMDYTLTNLNIICDMDIGFFDKIEVMDEGYLNEDGMPTWFRNELKSGETWEVHFEGTTRPDISPGTVITSQALITADTVSLLLSDDPTTPEKDDYTAVTIRLINGSITGKVEDEKYGTPITASVAIDGPVAQSIATDEEGNYSFSNLPPGVYKVSVDAENYEYHSPAGAVTVTLDGTVESVQVDFLMRHADTIPPVSSIFPSADEIVQESMTEIYGTAYDYAPGSGVRKVELCIERNNDRKYWDGDSWGDDETWLLAKGTTEWTFNCGGITWDSNFSYAIKSRATDNAGNVERPTVITTTSTLQAPALISPANGTSVEYIPTFEWSYVLDSCYYLQIDNDRGFRSPEIDASYLTYNTYTPGEIEEGTYYWRVKAVDMERGYPESKWSEVWAVTILPSQPPDLEIIKKWENWVDKEKGTYTVSYVVHNNGTTVAPAGHHTTLYIDEEAVEHKPVPVTLKPCGTYEDTFKTVVKCTPPGDKMMVCADNYDKVKELDEGNNCMTNVWQCPVPVRKPDLVIKDIKLTRMDGYCYVYYLISNTGTVNAAASTTYLYVDDKKVASDSTGALAAGVSRWDMFTAYRTTGTHTYKVCADGPNIVEQRS
jgi:rhodanese-related sulfurtransferase